MLLKHLLKTTYVRHIPRMYFALSAAADAKCWFVKLWSSLELFGFEFLSCTNIDTRDKGLIGVSKDRVSRDIRCRARLTIVVIETQQYLARLIHARCLCARSKLSQAVQALGIYVCTPILTCADTVPVS